MILSDRRLPMRRYETLESRYMLSGSPLPFDDSGNAPSGLTAVCALPNLPVFNVDAYGAKGDGVTDDTLAIRAALNAAQANGGGIIYLPAGTYAVDPQATDASPYGPGSNILSGSIFTITSSNIIFIGDGVGQTHLKGYVAGLKDPATNWYDTGDSYSKVERFGMFAINSTPGGVDLSNIQFRSLDIDGDAPYTGYSLVGGDPATGDGWDMSHKAIRMDGHNAINDVLVFNCQIENWRGEEIYSGGNLIGNVYVVNTQLTGTNADAISCSATIVANNVTIGGTAAGDDVYNGFENFMFPTQSTTVTNCNIRCGSSTQHGFGMALEGEVGSSITVTGTTFTNCGEALLFGDTDSNATIDGNQFSNCNNAIIIGDLGLYATGTNGFFYNFAISNNVFTQTQSAFINQGQTFTGLTFTNNTVNNGTFLSGDFEQCTAFTVSGTVLASGTTDMHSYTGSVAVWSNTTRPTDFPLGVGIGKQDFFSGTTGIIQFYSDLTILNSDPLSSSPFDVDVDPTELGDYPVGFETNVIDWSNTNWVLKANSSWNTFSSDVPIGPNGVQIKVNSQGLFELVGQAAATATSTALGSSASTAVFGQSLTFTATVTATGSGAGTPTGTVTFKNGATVLGTGTLNASGQATFSTSALALGAHTITAVYAGDTDFATSSGQLTETINQSNSSVALGSSASTAVFGQSLTFTATVTATGSGAGTPTGTVTFKNGATVLGTGTLNASGQATFSTSALALGAHTITAVYAGDTDFATSSGQLTETINQSNSSVALGSSASTAVFGQSLTFTATVTATGSGAGTPTGTVTFKNGATVLGTGTLNASGQATFSTSALALGAHTITAVYAGDTDFATSSGQLTETINQSNSSVALGSSASTAVFGQSLTFTATVTATGSGAGTPTGTVTFKNGATVLGTGTLNASGQATFSTSALALGAHTITAVYAGDTDFATSSGQLTETINQSNSSVALGSSASTAVFGQSLTFTATVTATGSGAGTPTGTVTFKNGATVLGTGTLNASGQATFSTSALALGAHTITAVYAGDTDFATSSGQLTETINQSNSSVALGSSASTAVFGQSLTFTATVTATGSGAGTPTGTVTFKNGATVLGTGTLNTSGQATFSTSALALGAHTITAVYAGDTDFTTSNGQLTETINQAINQGVGSTNSSTVLTSTAKSFHLGDAVTIWANVRSSVKNAGTINGTVTFKEGSTVLGTGILNTKAYTVFDASQLALGTHTISATYNGNIKYVTSVGSLTITIIPAMSTTLAASTIAGSAVTLTATVTPKVAAVGMPTGTVTFMEGATILGTCTLDSSGRASFCTSALAKGTHKIKVCYNGDTDFVANVAKLLKLKIK